MLPDRPLYPTTVGMDARRLGELELTGGRKALAGGGVGKHWKSRALTQAWPPLANQAWHRSKQDHNLNRHIGHSQQCLSCAARCQRPFDSQLVMLEASLITCIITVSPPHSRELPYHVIIAPLQYMPKYCQHNMLCYLDSMAESSTQVKLEPLNGKDSINLRSSIF